MILVLKTFLHFQLLLNLCWQLKLYVCFDRDLKLSSFCAKWICTTNTDSALPRGCQWVSKVLEVSGHFCQRLLWVLPLIDSDRGNASSMASAARCAGVRQDINSDLGSVSSISAIKRDRFLWDRATASISVTWFHWRQQLSWVRWSCYWNLISHIFYSHVQSYAAPWGETSCDVLMCQERGLTMWNNSNWN